MHMDFWNQADIFYALKGVQLLNILRIIMSVFWFCKGIWTKIETSNVAKVILCLGKHEDYEEIFVLLPKIAVDILVCITWAQLLDSVGCA